MEYSVAAGAEYFIALRDKSKRVPLFDCIFEMMKEAEESGKNKKQCVTDALNMIANKTGTPSVPAHAMFFLQHSYGSVMIRTVARACFIKAAEEGVPVTVDEILVGGPCPEIPVPFFLDRRQRRIVRSRLWRARNGVMPKVAELLVDIDLPDTNENFAAVAEVIANDSVAIWKAEEIKSARTVIRDYFGINEGRGTWDDLTHMLSHSNPPGGAACVLVYPTGTTPPVHAFVHFRDHGRIKCRQSPALDDYQALKRLRKDLNDDDVKIASTLDRKPNAQSVPGVIYLENKDNWSEDTLNNIENILTQNGIEFQEMRAKPATTSSVVGTSSCSSRQAAPRNRSGARNNKHHDASFTAIKVGGRNTGDLDGEEALKEAAEAGKWILQRSGCIDCRYSVVDVDDASDLTRLTPGQIPHPSEWSALDQDALLSLFSEVDRPRVIRTVQVYKELTEHGKVALVPFPSKTLKKLRIPQRIIKSRASALACENIPSKRCRQIVVGDFGNFRTASFPDSFPRCALDGDIDELIDVGCSVQDIEVAWSESRVQIPLQEALRKQFVTVRDVNSTLSRSCIDLHEEVILFPNGIGAANLEDVEAALTHAKNRCEQAEAVLLYGPFCERYKKRIIPQGVSWFVASVQADYREFRNRLSKAREQHSDVSDDDGEHCAVADDEDFDDVLDPQIIKFVDSLIDQNVMEPESRASCLSALRATEQSVSALGLPHTDRGGLILLAGDPVPQEVPVTPSSPTFRLACLSNHEAEWKVIRGISGGGAQFCKFLKNNLKRCVAWHLRHLGQEESIPVARQMIYIQIDCSAEAVRKALDEIKNRMKIVLGQDLYEKLSNLAKNSSREDVNLRETLIFSSLWLWCPRSHFTATRQQVLHLSPLEGPRMKLSEFVKSLERRCAASVIVANLLVDMCANGKCIANQPERLPLLMDKHTKDCELRLDRARRREEVVQAMRSLLSLALESSRLVADERVH